MLTKEFERPFGNACKGMFLNDKIHQMIWSRSLLKWLSRHSLGFSYGDQIRKILTCQNRRKLLFCIRVVKGLSDARIKVDVCTKDDAHMAWHGIDDYVA